MKIYMCTDLEGVSGVVGFDHQTRLESRYYEQAKSLLTAEVNAAAEGFFKAGADEIVVLDGHGSGAIRFEELHPKLKLIHGSPILIRDAIDEVIGGFDVCCMIGQHAMAGTVDGNLNHTQDSLSVEYYKLNGKVIGEIAQFSLYVGSLGVPMIFLTGDRAACREAEGLIEGISTVAVKQGLTRTSAISIAPPTVHEMIRRGAEQALNAHRERAIAPLAWPGPYVLEKRFFTTTRADLEMLRPGVERVDPVTIRIAGDNIRDIIFA